jgi:two-component system LytT family sensor kinase
MKPNKLLWNVLLWAALYLFWIIVFHNRTLTISRTITVEFCYLLFVAANFYMHVYFSIPAFLYQKKYWMFGIALLAGIVLAALLRVPLAMYLNAHFFLVNKAQPPFAVLFLNSFVNIFVWVICLDSGKLVIDKIRTQKYIETIENENEKNELKFLKAQFNPHFLFNSLNSIYGHIDKKNPVA